LQDNVKVTAAVLCYNQSCFITEALESVLTQRADFPIEIVVADDFSTDGTKEIVEEFAGMHPDTIRVLPRSQHVGLQRNWMDLYAACRGEYVAFLEGDDYWTSPHKLQKQADLLDSSPGLEICHHRAFIVFDRAAVPSALHPAEGAKVAATLEDLLCGDCIVTCSTMVRRRFNTLPAWFADLPTLDWPTFVLHAMHGNIGYLPEPMAAYRQHAGGVWSSLSRLDKLPRKIEVRSRVAAELGSPYQAMLSPVIDQLTRELHALSPIDDNPAARKDAPSQHSGDPHRSR